MPHLFKGFDDSFAERAKADDIIMAGGTSVVEVPVNILR